MSKLILTKFKEAEGKKLTANGLIMVNPKKPEYGSIMLMQPSYVLGGFMNTNNKVAFQAGRVEELQKMITTNKLQDGSDICETDLGKHRIVVLEKLESEVNKLPENEQKSYQAKINPETKQELVKDGEQIFRMTTIVQDNSEIVDVRIQHDKTEVTTSSTKAKSSELTA